MRSIVQLALRGYKRWISPMFPPSCKYTPTCSEYAMEAVERHGVVVGGLMSAWRLLRCNPFAEGGYDPVENARERVGSERSSREVFCHPERSEGAMHPHAAAKCIDSSLRSG